MRRRQKLAIVGAALVGVVVVGAAIGATKALTPKQEHQAVIDDAAQQLGVQPSELSKALKDALKKRVDAAVADGRLTKEQAARMKERIDTAEAPLFGLGPRGFRHHHRGHHKGMPGMFGGKLEGAAAYLGFERRELFEALSGDKTLADLARDRGKSVDGLIDAMVEATGERLDEAVANGKLTEADKKEVLADLKGRITRLVNEGFPMHRKERGAAYFVPSVF